MLTRCLYTFRVKIDQDFGDRPEYQTWELRVRAMGSPDAFRPLRLRARSAPQAEAIAHRQGLEVETGSTCLTDEPPDTVSSILAAAVGPLKCSRCGYSLHGLIINQAAVTCPECAFTQVLVPFVPHPETTLAEQARGKAATPDSREETYAIVALIVGAVVLLMLFNL